MLSSFFDSLKKNRPARDDQTGGWDDPITCFKRAHTLKCERSLISKGNERVSEHLS